ncbi:RnfABCDGE type electron transport complex subunit B [Acinetobacter qingfengensis]|uniref:Iron-sulfur protein n=1 Tax=Acinetobacter qingfengensis TaxID=1262585 RepID=A0A1E7RED4_9GAMM|nr:RnfABCDGE type electron transport complex subunit B [Acinetobacter qingfengensis]KAA8734747.1 RnfABCDGE type electron transport complex subunit B [Acinetobacter qingfengensis]OEY97708.1 iron-sulfur protein [Acinetobacter qingfengensis]
MSSPLQSLIYQIDQLLPQTQCGLCGHRAGCLPYAQAIAAGESANKCVPGGQPVADAIANLLGREHLPAEPSVWDVQADGRPQRIKAVIKEDECIGCTKCIAACPVDAIIGSGKMMHTILTDLCTGCELCLEPCPVDCIDLVPDLSPLPHPAQRITEQNSLRNRYKAHLLREQSRQEQRTNAHPVTRAGTSKAQLEAIIGNTVAPPPTSEIAKKPIQDAKTTIELAKLRTQIKKLQKQISMRADNTKAQQLAELEQRLHQLMEA